jgi:hypothetical protein
MGCSTPYARFAHYDDQYHVQLSGELDDAIDDAEYQKAIQTRL